MRRALAILLVTLGAGLCQVAGATDPQEVVPGTCVSKLRSGPEFGSGIATGGVVRVADVLLCDGAVATLSAFDGAIGLKETPGDYRIVESRIRLGSGATPQSEDEGVGSEVACAADMLYDAEPSVIENTSFALLIGPTEDYRHAILGDPIEASGFCALDLWSGETATLDLSAGSVFEDLRVRLVDLTGDGRAEFVVIRSYLDRGAALAVYRLVEGRIEHLAETPPIGIANRWLNPAGAADFDGDGRVEIAYVETPHIGGTLRVWELVEGELRQEQAVAGFSNHAIGSRELDLSAVLDWNADGVPDLAVPANGRRSLRIVSFAGGTFAELDTVPHDAEIATAILATDLDADGRPELLYGLEDGRLMLARP
ncbi:MAG: VCBS repeat-containing protein [Kiloniellales bacterium]|nr:VCBS repeat-containing protein [Kiloniellales bacterium]